MVKGIYSGMIHNLQLSGGYQYLQYINAFIMEPEFVLMDNIMHRMMGKLSQILKLYKGDPSTPTFSKAMTGPYKDEFIQDMTQDIKEL